MPETPDPRRLATHASPVRSRTRKLLVLLGNSLTLIGCAGLLLGVTGIVSLEWLAGDISSGIRAMGSVAIAGCLLSAVGYGIPDYLE